MNRYTFIAEDVAGTDQLGAALAEFLPVGTTIALCGTLGAGKTRLVQAVAAACGVPREEVVSPTFIICQEYCGSKTICHLDAYRLRDDDEFRQLGPEEFFRSPSLVFIEWADRIRESLPRERIEIHIEVLEGDRRGFEIQAHGDRFIPLLEQIRARLSGQDRT